MRYISPDNDAILTGGARSVAFRIQVKEADGTYRDLSTYPGVDLIEALNWGEALDNPGVVWDATLTREQESLSLAPLMAASPLNRSFNPAGAYSALLQVGRGMKVEYAMLAEDDPRARTWVLAFEGYIDKVDSGGGDVVKLNGRGLEARIANSFIKRERVYAFAQGANADRGCYVWAPSTVWVVGDRLVPTDSKRNDHFYRVTTGGTGGTTEPAYPTGGGSTVADGGAVFTESGATSTSTGTAVETVMQQLLDDNLGSGVVTVVTPVSPAWQVRWFLVSRQPVLDELKLLADQIGWCLRYMGNGSTSEFRFFDPGRGGTTSLRSFGPTQVDDYRRLSTEWQGIRNAIRVIFSDSQDLDAAGNPKRKVVDRVDAASQTKYGELFAEIAEASNSNIDTTAEAQGLADAVLSDLAEPTADAEATLLAFFGYAEVCDLYTLSADGVHFDADQKLAVSSFDHHVSFGEQSTTLRLRGKPASNSAQGWFERMADAGGAEQHQVTSLENVTPIALTVDTLPVGGARIDFTWNSAKNPKDTRFELHLSTTPGFTPDASSLYATGKEQAFEVGNLDPSVVYYGVVVPVTWNNQQLVRGSPSAAVSFSPGRALATQLNPNVQWGRLPLNGGFETQLDPAAAPDFWFTKGGNNGSWGTNAFALTDASGISGDKYLKLLSTSGTIAARIDSAEFTVNEKKRVALSVWRKNVAGTGATNGELGLNFFDKDHAIISAVSESWDLTDQVGTWVKQVTGSVAPPATSRFARLYLKVLAGTGNEVHLDDAQFDVNERWHAVGASGEPAFLNSWVNFGNPYAPARFMMDVDGWVTLEGMVKSGTVGTAVFTLPAGWRPATNFNVYVPQSNDGGFGVVEIQSDGTVLHAVGGGNTSLTLQARWLATQ